MQQHGPILEYYAEWILDQKDYILYGSIHTIFQKMQANVVTECALSSCLQVQVEAGLG